MDKTDRNKIVKLSKCNIVYIKIKIYLQGDPWKHYVFKWIFSQLKSVYIFYYWLFESIDFLNSSDKNLAKYVKLNIL